MTSRAPVEPVVWTSVAMRGCGREGNDSDWAALLYTDPAAAETCEWRVTQRELCHQTLEWSWSQRQHISLSSVSPSSPSHPSSSFSVCPFLLTPLTHSPLSPSLQLLPPTWAPTVVPILCLPMHKEACAAASLVLMHLFPLHTCGLPGKPLAYGIHSQTWVARRQEVEGWGRKKREKRIVLFLSTATCLMESQTGVLLIPHPSHLFHCLPRVTNSVDSPCLLQHSTKGRGRVLLKGSKGIEKDDVTVSAGLC